VEVEVAVDQDQDVEVVQMDHKDQLHLLGDRTQLLQVVAKVLEELKDSEMMALEQILATELQEAVGLEETPSVDTQEEMPEILILKPLRMMLSLQEIWSMICNCLTRMEMKEPTE